MSKKKYEKEKYLGLRKKNNMKQKSIQALEIRK